MEFHVAGLLFDNDGVLVDSHQAAIDAWTKWCSVYSPGLDWDAQGTAGVRAEDMVRMWAPAEKFSEANDYINALELETAGTTIPLPGSLDLLDLGQSAPQLIGNWVWRAFGRLGCQFLWSLFVAMMFRLVSRLRILTSWGLRG
jgi:beta-phosphoglucomutase-like phosphatase (HAD superfamily)